MDMTKFDQRMARLVAATNARSDSELARMLGIQPQSVAAARKRQQIPGAWIEQVAEKYVTSANWLLFGEGSTLREIGSTPASVARKKSTCDVDMVYVPLVEARLSAGTGSFEAGGVTEQRYGFRNDWISTKGQPSMMVLMRVAGESMEPEIHHGDVVLVDQSQTQPQPGSLFAVGVEDLVYIKMVDTLPGKIILKSCNDSYAPLEIDTRGDLSDGIRIIGKAVWLGRELR